MWFEMGNKPSLPRQCQSCSALPGGAPNGLGIIQLCRLLWKSARFSWDTTILALSNVSSSLEWGHKSRSPPPREDLLSRLGTLLIPTVLCLKDYPSTSEIDKKWVYPIPSGNIFTFGPLRGGEGELQPPASQIWLTLF